MTAEQLRAWLQEARIKDDLNRPKLEAFLQSDQPTLEELQQVVARAPADPRLRTPSGWDRDPLMTSDRIETASQLVRIARKLLPDVRAESRAPEASPKPPAAARPAGMPDASEQLLLHRRLGQVADAVIAESSRRSKRSRARRWGGPGHRASLSAVRRRPD